MQKPGEGCSNPRFLTRIRIFWPDPVWTPGSGLNTRIRSEHPDPVWTPGSGLNTRIRTEHPDPDWTPGSDLNTRFRSEQPDPVVASGSGLKTRIRISVYISCITDQNHSTEVVFFVFQYLDPDPVYLECRIRIHIQDPDTVFSLSSKNSYNKVNFQKNFFRIQFFSEGSDPDLAWTNGSVQKTTKQFGVNKPFFQFSFKSSKFYLNKSYFSLELLRLP